MEKPVETVSRNVGRCLTATQRKDFNEFVARFAEFVHVSQFNSKPPKHVSEVSGALKDNFRISAGEILYGVEEDGSLTWLGQIIDSSD